MPVFRACLVHSIYHNPNDEDEDGDEEEEEDGDEDAHPRPLMARVICLGVAWLLPIPSPLPSLFCQLQMIFKTTAAKENVGVTRVVKALADNLAKFSFINILLVIALADNLNLAKPQAVVHFRLALPLNRPAQHHHHHHHHHQPAIGAPVIALHQLRLFLPLSASTNTGQLGHRAAPPTRG